jgi:hypothetical protein
MQTVSIGILSEAFDRGKKLHGAELKSRQVIRLLSDVLGQHFFGRGQVARFEIVSNLWPLSGPRPLEKRGAANDQTTDP